MNATASTETGRGPDIAESDSYRLEGHHGVLGWVWPEWGAYRWTVRDGENMTRAGGSEHVVTEALAECRAAIRRQVAMIGGGR